MSKKKYYYKPHIKKMVYLPRVNGSGRPGYMYSGDSYNPIGTPLNATSYYGVPDNKWSMCCIEEGNIWGSPRAHPSIFAEFGTKIVGETCTFAVYEGTMPSKHNIQLKGLSIDCINNGELLLMQGTRTYNMPCPEQPYEPYIGVTCKYYEFIIPNVSGDIHINPIWENIS